MDGDSLSNWEEFAFGSNPATHEPAPKNLPGVIMGPSGLEFSFLFRSDASDLGGFTFIRPLRQSFSWTSSENGTRLRGLTVK